MSLFDSIGSIFSNETSHIGNLLSSWGKSPGKTLAQFALGAQDPLGAKLWNGVTGEHFTPSVGQFGGETDAQFAQSRKQGVDTGTSQTLGQIANVVAAVWGGAEAGSALGAAAGGAGGASSAAGGDALGVGADASASAGGGAADSGSVNLFADAVPGAGGDVGASAGSGAGAGTGAGTGTSGTSSTWLDYGKSAAKTLAPVVASSLLAPKPPKTKAPTAMPDPLAQQQAVQQKLIAQMARRGRSSTILTNPSNGGSLGG